MHEEENKDVDRKKSDDKYYHQTCTINVGSLNVKKKSKYSDGKSGSRWSEDEYKVEMWMKRRIMRGTHNNLKIAEDIGEAVDKGGEEEEKE